MRNIIIFSLVMVILEGVCGAQPTDILGPIENNYVAVQLNNDYYSRVNIGAFNIGTSSLHPTRPNETLTYHYPGSPWSSHTVFNIDSNFYSPYDFGTDSCITLIEPTIPFEICSLSGDSSYIEGGWIIENVRIIQTLQTVYLDDTTGSILIKYSIYNEDSLLHRVGMMLELDLMIASMDRPLIETDCGSYYSETELIYPDMPTYWIASESYPPQIDDLQAIGYLGSYEAVMPDRFLIGQWGAYVSVIWDYTPSFEPYTDIAFLLYWFPITIAPGESTYISTYLGSIIRRSDIIESYMNKPSDFQIHVVPNPFNSSCVIAAPAGAEIEIYDLRGNV
ncbi:hypothetical protein DRQ33_06860, partial [bacterium]